MNASFTVSEKTAASTANMNLTKQEAEQVAQAFGLKPLDWRRFSDVAAANWFAAKLRSVGADTFYAALSRVRRLAGRERGFWYATIAAVNPKYNFMKNPPDCKDGELWIAALGIFLIDEQGKVLQQLETNLMEQILEDQK